MPELESGYSEYLFTIAQCYLGLGYSVLPVYGNLDIQRAKVCPIPWTYFQQHRATHTDLRNWFIHMGFGGVAIVCGRISGLIVLDFDNPALAEEFTRRYPDLTETWTVQSGGRRLPHYYYRLPLHASLASQKRDGVDLQSGGRYVVAPPTTIATMEWRVLRGGQPRMLTERDLRRISAFVAAQSSESQENASDPSLFAFLSASDRKESHSISQYQNISVVSGENQAGKLYASSGTDHDPASLSRPQTKSQSGGEVNRLISRYLKLAPSGRNEALFHTAIWARDHGWGEAAVKHCLVEPHVGKQPASQHPSETADQRRREARRTIESAFSRPPRAVSQDRVSGFISNTVRESLLQRRETAALRVLEAFTMAGWQPGHVFTERDAREVARTFTVGDWSVRKALRQAHLFDPAPANDADAGINTQNTEYKKCFFVNQTKPTKNKPRGRPVRYYVMPDMQTLCERLGVEPAPGDRIAAEDLRSCRLYRQAVLRELVRRRPGCYSRDWLADLLGVSVTTTRRYTHEMSFSVTPVYHESLLLWRNLGSLIPPDIQDARPGSFLEDADGKKYPPLQPVARYLLGKSGFVRFRWRGVNHYAYAKSEEAPPIPAEPDAVSRQEDESRLSTLPSQTYRQPTTVMPVSPPQALLKPQDTEKPPPQYDHPLEDKRLEEAARRVCERLAQMDARRTLSLANARALVTRYGAFAVEHLVETMQKRGDVRNPAGFLAARLQSQYGFMDEDSLTIAEIYAAERAFLVTREINPKRALSWQNACNLARQYGQVAIENAIKILRQRNVTNPAGLMVKLLRSEPALASIHHNQPDDQFVEYVFGTLRQMNPQRALSRKMVRRIVAARGRQAVTDALHRIKQHSSVQNPAGLLVTMLHAQEVVRKQHSKRRTANRSDVD